MSGKSPFGDPYDSPYGGDYEEWDTAPPMARYEDWSEELGCEDEGDYGHYADIDLVEEKEGRPTLFNRKCQHCEVRFVTEGNHRFCTDYCEKAKEGLGKGEKFEFDKHEKPYYTPGTIVNRCIPAEPQARIPDPDPCCRQCGWALPVGSGKFCSPNCEAVHKRAERKAERKKERTKKCIHCKEEFYSVSGLGEYCSQICISRAYGKCIECNEKPRDRRFDPERCKDCHNLWIAKLEALQDYSQQKKLQVCLDCGVSCESDKPSVYRCKQCRSKRKGELFLEMRNQAMEEGEPKRWDDWNRGRLPVATTKQRTWEEAKKKADAEQMTVYEEGETVTEKTYDLVEYCHWDITMRKYCYYAKSGILVGHGDKTKGRVLGNQEGIEDQLTYATINQAKMEETHKEIILTGVVSDSNVVTKAYVDQQATEEPAIEEPQEESFAVQTVRRFKGRFGFKFIFGLIIEAVLWWYS